MEPRGLKIVCGVLGILLLGMIGFNVEQHYQARKSQWAWQIVKEVDPRGSGVTDYFSLQLRCVNPIPGQPPNTPPQFLNHQTYAEVRYDINFVTGELRVKDSQINRAFRCPQ